MKRNCNRKESERFSNQILQDLLLRDYPVKVFLLALCIDLDKGSEGGILGTFVGCPGNRLWLHLNRHIWKMNLISLHTVSVIHSFYAHLLSGRKAGRRWMLNLYVNFNIKAILHLKNKINASISFLMWYWKLSSLGEKITPECILPKFQSSRAEQPRKRQSCPCWWSMQGGLQRSHSITYYLSVKGK